MIGDISEKVVSVIDMHWGYFSQRCKELRETANLNCINKLNGVNVNQRVLNKPSFRCIDFIPINSHCDMPG